MTSYLYNGQEEANSYKLLINDKHIKGRVGERLGKGTGNSLEFQEYRDYQPFDDLRYIDWRIYGKTDKLVVKRFREELQPKTEVITDISRSLKTPNIDKANAVLFLTGFILESSLNSGSVCSWWTFGNSFNKIIPFSKRLDKLHDVDFIGTTSLQEEYQIKQPGFIKHGVRIFISDFLWDNDPEKLFFKMAAGASAVILIMVTTKEELNPVMAGYNNLIDIETGEKIDILINPGIIKKYKENLDNHINNWKRTCEKYGGLFCIVYAEDILNKNFDDLINNRILEIIS